MLSRVADSQRLDDNDFHKSIIGAAIWRVAIKGFIGTGIHQDTSGYIRTLEGSSTTVL